MKLFIQIKSQLWHSHCQISTLHGKREWRQDFGWMEQSKKKLSYFVPVIQVNGVNIEGMRHAEVVAFIKKGGDETWLLVVDPETDEHFKRRGVIPTVSHVKGGTAMQVKLKELIWWVKTSMFSMFNSQNTFFMCDLLVFADYDGPSMSNGSPSPQINGSSTTQSIRSTHSDLSSQGNSTQVGVGIHAQWCVWALYLDMKVSTLNLCVCASVSPFPAGRRWGRPAVGPLFWDGPESQRDSGRREEEGPCQRKEEGPADGLDEETWALQQFLRHSAPRTQQRPKDRARRSSPSGRFIILIHRFSSS